MEDIIKERRAIKRSKDRAEVFPFGSIRTLTQSCIA
jgi:hypothetical protein